MADFARLRSGSRDQDLVLLCRRCGYADDQACGRDNSIVGSKNCRSQPPDAVDQMFLFVRAAGTAHGCFREAFEPDG
jgi:hypothetical protein